MVYTILENFHLYYCGVCTLSEIGVDNNQFSLINWETARSW